jgi:type IV secretion system protein VirD4
MAQKTGALIFDETADRYDIRFDIADYYGGLHCGECMDVFTGGKWNAEDIKPYIDPMFENNVLLTQTERLMMSSRPKHPKYARNKNVLVIGGSGSGKTRFFVKPNLMQMHSSYVVTDPKGTVLIECGKLLQRGGYKIKVLNTINFKKSMRYNPFAYLRSEKDILKLVNTIIANTKGDGEKSGEDFWVKSERLFYCALIGYIWYEAPENEKNFTTLLEMINASEAREDDPEFQSPVDLMFERLEEKDPEHFAVRQYKKFLLSAGKTRSSILISCGARLAPFDIRELRELMETDEMELDTLGDRTAIRPCFWAARRKRPLKKCRKSWGKKRLTASILPKQEDGSFPTG